MHSLMVYELTLLLNINHNNFIMPDSESTYRVLFELSSIEIGIKLYDMIKMINAHENR